MVPKVWLYTKDLTTIRIVQRDSAPGSEVFIFGPDGQNQQTFSSIEHASRFREALVTRIMAIGYALASQSPDTPADRGHAGAHPQE
jgi:hypothetical protein